MARDFHPRHCPPLGFLNPSTVYSSEHVVCLVSYRHHLWDSKNRNDSVKLRVSNGLSEDMPNEDTKSGRASDESPTNTSPAVTVSLRLFDQLFTSEHGVDVSLTWYPASEIPGRRTHQTARPLRTRHMKCRFSSRKLVKCQRPKNTEDSRQADHHPLPSHPHQTTSLTAKTIRSRKPVGLRLLPGARGVQSLRPRQFHTDQALTIRVAPCPRTGCYADSQVPSGLRFTIRSSGHLPTFP